MRFFKVLIILALLILAGCGSETLVGSPGPEGPKGPSGDTAVPIKLEEGLESALKCMDEALPKYELKSVSVSDSNGDINIKYKER